MRLKERIILPVATRYSPNRRCSMAFSIRLIVSFMLTLTLIGCGGGAKDKIEAFAKDGCACADLKCYEAVREKMKAFGKELQAKYPNPSDAPEELVAAAKTAEKTMRGCKQEIRKKDKSVVKSKGASLPSSGSAKACQKAEKAFRATSTKDKVAFRRSMASVIGKCGGACNAGDKGACTILDRFMKTLCEVSPAICKNLCKAMKTPATQAAACKYAK